jgi:hypothetical protein
VYIFSELFRAVEDFYLTEVAHSTYYPEALVLLVNIFILRAMTPNHIIEWLVVTLCFAMELIITLCFAMEAF